MANKQGVLTVNSIFLALTSLAAAFQCYGLLFLLLLKERRRQQQMTLQAAHQHSGMTQIRTKESSFLARKTLAKSWSHRTVVAEPLQQNSAESEWKKNLRMDHDVFIALVDEIRPYLQPGRSPRGLDVLSVEKQLALTLYFLKDQGSLSMTANAFGIAHCTVSVIVRKVCDVIARVLGPK